MELKMLTVNTNMYICNIYNETCQSQILGTAIGYSFVGPGACRFAIFYQFAFFNGKQLRFVLTKATAINHLTI